MTDFATAYKKVRGKVSEMSRTESVQEYLPKLGTLGRDDFKEGFKKAYKRIRAVKDVINDNKEIVIPLATSVGAYVVTCHTGYTLPHFDKVFHILWGYGTSRLGRKIARKVGKEEYEGLASLGMSLGSGLGIELWESHPVTMSISNAIAGATYKKEFGLQTIDSLDLVANFGGFLTENLRNYATRAKDAILKRVRKSKK